MNIHDLKYQFLSETGIFEPDIQREDGIISNRIIKKFKIDNFLLLDIDFKVINWHIDNRTDIIVQSESKNEFIRILNQYRFTSYRDKVDDDYNIVLLRSITDTGFKNLSFEDLNLLVNGNIVKYFESQNVKIFRRTLSNNSFIYSAKYPFYSAKHFAEIYKVCVIKPLIKSIENQQIQFVTNKTIKPKEYRYHNNLFWVLFLVILFSAWFTYASRKLIGCNCNDGTNSSATGSGACSSHGGVSTWNYQYWWDK